MPASYGLRLWLKNPRDLGGGKREVGGLNQRASERASEAGLGGGGRRGWEGERKEKMALRPGKAPRVRVDGSSGRPVSARRGKTVEERRAEIVAANARLRGQLERENCGRSTGVCVRTSTDPELRTLETQRDTLRAQLLQLTGVLASRRAELAELLRGSTTSRPSQPPSPSQRANGPHGHYQQYVMPSEPAAAQLDASGLALSDPDDSDYTDLDFANDAAVVAAEGWGDESELLEERSGDWRDELELQEERSGNWRDDMMSVISRDKRAAERGSSRLLLSVDPSSTGSASGSEPNVGAGSHSGSKGSSLCMPAVTAPASAPTPPASASVGGRLESTISVTVAAYDWSDEDQAYLHASSTCILVDLVEPHQGAGTLQLSPAEMFYSNVKRAVGWDEAKHGAFFISDCVASEGPAAPDMFGGSHSLEDVSNREVGHGVAQPLLDAFTVRGLGLWHGCTVQVRRPDPRAPLC